MPQQYASFASLFKKYRLKAEFPTLSSFALALSEKGFIYEDSIFSHWQKGTRVPQNRIIALKVLEIFIEKHAITTISQANIFLSAAQQSQLTSKEIAALPKNLEAAIFQVPNEITNFTAREEIITRIVEKENIWGKVLFIHGPGGVGKTALAIKLGHILKEQYSDGVLWYKVEENNIMDILLSMGRILGEDISGIHNLNVRMTVIRALLTNKKMLLIFDSAELNDNIHLLIPRSDTCTTIITSQKGYLKTPIPHIDIDVRPFTDMETLGLFKNVLKETYKKTDKVTLVKLAKRVGNLPLAVHLLARQISNNNIQVSQLPSLLHQENSFFSDLYKEEKSLYSAIAMTYQKLEPRLRSILLSASIFKGKDFSIDSIAYINGISKQMTVKMLEQLVKLSLIEKSTKNRYRTHPLIQRYAQNKLNFPRSSLLSLIALGVFLIYLTSWFLLHTLGTRPHLIFHIFSGTYGVIAVYGSIYGIHTSLLWGGWKTDVGKAIMMFSLGLLFQEFGQLTYSYLGIISVNPYPSIGDVGFFGTIILYIIGIVYLAKSSGIRITIHTLQSKLFILIIPLVMLITAYTCFLILNDVDFSNPLKTFLDFAYPLGASLYITLAILTFIFSRTNLDGLLKSKALLILLALIIQALSDYVFLHNSLVYQPWSVVDLLYLISYTTMTLALLNMRSLRVNVKV